MTRDPRPRPRPRRPGAVSCLADAAPRPRAAAAVWSPVPMPPGRRVDRARRLRVRQTGLVLAGDGGHVAVTRDGVAPGGTSSSTASRAPCAAVAHDLRTRRRRLRRPRAGDRRRRGVGQAAMSAAPARAPESPTSPCAAQGFAVGEGRDDLASADAGVTWRRETSPTSSPITHVALGGTAPPSPAPSPARSSSAAPARGRLPAGAGPAVTGSPPRGPSGATARRTSTSASGADVLGSDDAFTFASLPEPPQPSTQPWSALALVACLAAPRCSSRAPVRAGFLACWTGLAVGPVRAPRRRDGGRSRRPERRLSPRL